MKIIYRILCGSFAMVLSCAALASSEPPYGDETPNPESKPMAFAQCIEIIRDYEDELGPAHVVIDTPALRIVQFTTDSERELITCDGDDSIITVLDPDED
jgi:hypothetical protein